MKRAAAGKVVLQPIAPALAKLAQAGRADFLKIKEELTPAERRELLKLAPRPDNTRWPSEIAIGKRFRQKFEGLPEMATSIDTLVDAGKPGLLQRIGITPKDQLIWGERRLRGYRQARAALTHPIPVEIYDIGAIIVGEASRRTTRSCAATSSSPRPSRSSAP